MLNQIKRWIIYRLGGVVLSEEEKNFLIPFYINKLNENAQKTLDRSATELLKSSYKSIYSE